MKRRDVLRWLAVGTLAPGFAGAYLLPGRSVLARASKRLARKEDLQVALVGRLREQGGETLLGERWIFSGRQVQVDINGPGGRKASWRRDGTTSGDPALLPTEAERLVLPRLFADADVSLLARDLRVDTEAGHLALLGDRVAHVVGVTHAERNDRRASALWIDQERFEVLRVRFTTATGPVDLRLAKWWVPSTRGDFPQRVRVTVGGRWVRWMEAERSKRVP